MLVLSAISHGHRHNGELLRRVEGISQKSLTRTLRELERNGLVSRVDHGTVPPSVDYALTTLGTSLQPLLHALCDWAIAHLDEVAAARSGRVRQQAAAAVETLTA